MDNELTDKKNLCGCVHHKMTPILITLIGLAFLLLRLDVLTQNFVDYAWPVLIIAIGVTKITGSKCKCC